MPKVRPEMTKQEKNNEKRPIDCIAEHFIASASADFGTFSFSPRRLQKTVIISARP
jgi:hypothetical protein